MENATAQKPECRCWVHHAITAEHRKQITANLEYFRSIGDKAGTLVSMAQLSPCPSVASR